MPEVPIDGSLSIAAPRASVVAALGDPEVLRQLIPGCTSIETVAAGRWLVRIGKTVGPVPLRLLLKMEADEIDAGASFALRLRGGSLISGPVALDLRLGLADAGDGTGVSYDGTLGAQGLAGRLLGAHSDDVRSVMAHRFDRLRRLVEQRPIA